MPKPYNPADFAPNHHRFVGGPHNGRVLNIPACFDLVTFNDGCVYRRDKLGKDDGPDFFVFDNYDPDYVVTEPQHDGIPNPQE